MAPGDTVKRVSVDEDNLQAVKEDVHLMGIETGPEAVKEVEDAPQNAHKTGTDTGTETEIETDITSPAMRARQHFKQDLNCIIATFSMGKHTSIQTAFFKDRMTLKTTLP